MESLSQTFVKIAACGLNQQPLDFTGNKFRIIESIKQAKQRCCSIRLGPELEIPGYGCEDHFLEIDTILHSWQILSHILQEDYTDNLLCAFGMPVLHNDVSYNCTVMCLNRKIILIRPKMAMADDGVYRESRYFTAWNAQNQLEQHLLPVFLQNIIHQEEAPLLVLSKNKDNISISLRFLIFQDPGLNLVFVHSNPLRQMAFQICQQKLKQS